MQSIKPADSDAEVIVFGKGVGESVLVHLGNGLWLIIDSFLTKSGVPVALEYLNDIGIDPKSAVSGVVITHWHKDHIEGIAEILETCSDAMFCCSQAMTTKEFERFVKVNSTRNNVVAGASTEEISKVFSCLIKDKRELKFSTSDKRIWMQDDCEVWCLSPSDQQITQFMSEIGGALMPAVGKPKRRIAPYTENHNSVVIQVCWGLNSADADSILLGADLEHVRSTKSGWAAIVGSKSRPQSQSTFFKIPHHGSENGHCDGVWDKLLVPNVACATSPYARGVKKLPAPSDVSRIMGRTDNAYLAKRRTRLSTKGNSSAVAKAIREVTKQYEDFDQGYGFVRFSKPIGSNNDWEVTLSDEACHFADL